MGAVDDAPETPQGLAYWLALVRAPRLGAAGIGALLERFGHPRAVFEADPGSVARLDLDEAARGYLRCPDWRRVEDDLRWLEHPGRALLTLGSPGYPARLREIPDPPPVLFVRGDASCLGWPQLAVVGTRHPTHSGRETAYAFARSLARAGLGITSGLALGIDAAAHRGALAAQGVTVAVAGQGLDRVYPARHAELAEAIAESGALVSEFPPGTPPAASNFPRRNRIISGLGLGVLVVEAARRSGSLITARLASLQGREVLAIPGSIHNPLARGCHALIRDGAKLVETAQDVLEEILPQARLPEGAAEPDVQAPPSEGLMADPEYAKLLSCLEFEPVAFDRVVERSGLTPEAVSSMLLILELEGFISSHPGGTYARSVSPDAKKRA